MPLSNRFAAMGEYSRSPVVRDRNYGGLAAWAAGQLQQPSPPNPDDTWIRLRILAERIPQTPDAYVQKLGPYLLQTSDVVDHIADHLAPYLEDDRADAVHTQITAAIQAVMPRLAAFEVGSPQIDQWRKDNGFPAPAANGSKP